MPLFYYLYACNNQIQLISVKIKGPICFPSIATHLFQWKSQKKKKITFTATGSMVTLKAPCLQPG